MQTRLQVPKNSLLLIAGLVRSLAGVMVMKIWLPLLFAFQKDFLLLLLAAILIFLLFYRCIFSPLVKKHTLRIRNFPAAQMPGYLFFDKKSYLVMIVMMSGGIVIRKFALIPEWGIAFFYSGLGLALASCGIKFLVGFLKKRGVDNEDV